MKTQSVLLAALASVPAALAHTTWTSYYVDGAPQGDGVAIRMNKDPSTSGSPIHGLQSDDMACNVGGTTGVSRVQSVKDGALLTFEMRSYADDPSKPPLDPGHKGPCAFYLKKVDSAINDKGAGDGWFKIFDSGYDTATSKWCTEKLIDNKGLFSVNLPKGLQGGYYLARPELLALHAVPSNNDPQFYTGCAQIFLESTGNLGPESTVSIPGYVDYNQPATDFNIYDTDGSKYTTLPGPEVAKLVAKSDMSTASSTQTEGLKPAGCIVENNNWCGFEVPSYTDETSCWASSKKCWDQQKPCYNAAGPTGDAGCKIWDTKCNAIDAACNSKDFNGPPNKDKDLTPDAAPIDVGLIMATVGGNDYTPQKTSATQQAASKTDTPANPTPSAGSSDNYNDNTNVAASATPSSSPAKTTFAVSSKPTPTDSYQTTPDSSKNDTPDDDNKPAYTITVPPSSAGAPEPTKAPEACPKGYKCVTVTDVETITQTVYVTATADSYKRAVGGFRQRRRHAHHM